MSLFDTAFSQDKCLKFKLEKKEKNEQNRNRAQIVPPPPPLAPLQLKSIPLKYE